ncbi:hypothetical protein Tco_0744401 [Tanacetum coccineum]
MNHQPLSALQIAYQSPQVSTQPMTKSPLEDSGFAVHVFSLGGDPLACLNKKPGRYSRWQGHSAKSSGETRSKLFWYWYKSNAASSGKIMQADRQGLLNVTIIKEKALLAEAQEAGQILDEEQLTFLADPGTVMISRMQKRFSWPTFPTMVLTLSKSCREKMIYSQIDDMIKEKLALKEQVDSLEQNLSKQIKEKECLLQTITVFKSESKEKEDKYMENEIDLEKKIKELDNIIFKVGQSAQPVHILSDDFGKCFTAQQELSAEQAFWLRMSNHSSKPSDASPVKIEAPKELSKVSLVNESLKKLKFYLAKFDNVVKIRTTLDARTEGEWGFEHTKVVFNNEIIPFLNSLKDIFNVFDRDLLNEIMEVKIVFDQMDAVVQQS